LGSTATCGNFQRILYAARLIISKCAFKGGFKEANEKKIHLVNDDPKAFGLLVNWLFGALCICQGFEEKVDEVHTLDWCKLYIMAKNLGIESLENEINPLARLCLENHADLITPKIISFVYNNTNTESSLREYLVMVTRNILLDDPDNLSSNSSKIVALNLASTEFHVDFIQMVVEEISY
jgi:hypothetical protein